MPEVGGEGKKVEPAQIDMDWSDICELRAWLRERVQVSIIQIMFSLYFLFMRC